MKHPSVWAFLFPAALLASGCGVLTDPAVRVATCLEKSAGSILRSGGATYSSTCDLALSGTYILLLHPAGELSDRVLLDAGVPGPVLAELRALRLGPQPSVYVIPLDGQDRPSRTTYQMNFVSIPALLVKTSRNHSVSLTVRRTGTEIAVVEVQ